jgi:hypothetical protein
MILPMVELEIIRDINRCASAMCKDYALGTAFHIKKLLRIERYALMQLAAMNG